MKNSKQFSNRQLYDIISRGRLKIQIKRLLITLIIELYLDIS